MLVCGYGRVGQNLARLLGEEGFPSLALDTDPATVRATRAAGDNVIYGDGKFSDAAGSVRLSGLVNMENFGSGIIVFDCLFVIDIWN